MFSSMMKYPENETKTVCYKDAGDRCEGFLFEAFGCLQIDADCAVSKFLPAVEQEWSSRNALRKHRRWEKIITARKNKRKTEKERKKVKRVEVTGTTFRHSKRFLKALTRERLMMAKDSGPKLCLDLSMTGHMTKKEIGRLAGQIRRLYGSNKKAAKPFWMYLTSFLVNSPIYEECMRMNDGFSSYLMDMTEESYLDLFPLETIVYLTPDSEQVLEDINPQKVYILGGLVDESIQKKVTFQKAQENGLLTARLPIRECMVKNVNVKNYHSEILAINQVFDVLSTYYETQSWHEALKAGVPYGNGFVPLDTVQ